MPLEAPPGNSGRVYLLAHRPEGVLAGKHHRGASGTEPDIVTGSFSANYTADGHEETMRRIRSEWDYVK